MAKRSGGGGFCALPEGCIAHVLSFTSPLDTCTLSVVSPIFRSAAESDTVWERFLPPDYQSIISTCSDSSLLASSPSKKHLFVTLCNNPIVIDSGKKSFSLDKWSGKKCYMLSASDLSISSGDTPENWELIPDPDSRFKEVAKFRSVCWLEIRGKISACMLSPTTLYAAYFVFKLSGAALGFEHLPAEVAMGLVGTDICTKSVYLVTERRQGRRSSGRHVRFTCGLRNIELQTSGPTSQGDEQYPKKRKDGWLEIELGEFFTNEGGDAGELEMSVFEVNSRHGKVGLIVQGIEIRPKASK